MRRMLWMALLAGPVALAMAQPVQAQCPGGGCGGGPGFGRPGFGVPPMGCPFGFCFRLFPGLHQHGPLVNYGPYSGYYPFEPYGPWSSDLRYTGPVGRSSAPSGWAPFLSRPFQRGGGECGQYALSTFRNVISRLNPIHRFGCGTACKAGCGN